MARAGGAYIVRDEDAGGDSGNVDKLYPYTLKGLTDALEEARYRSYAGPPQIVLTMAEGGMKLIRRYESFPDQLVEGLLFLVEKGRKDPFVRLLVAPEHLDLANRILGGSIPAELNYEIWEPILTEARERGELRADLDFEAVSKRPVVVTDADGNDSIAIRPMTILGLSWDHRALDGAVAAQFLATVKRLLESVA